MARLALRSGGSAWGPQRVALGLSIRELSRLTGISRGMLSLMEHGRMVPTGEEYSRVMAALENAERRGSVADRGGEPEASAVLSGG